MLDHDRLFKSVLKMFFAEFIELFFPKAASQVDLTKIHFLDTSVPGDKAACAADLVVRARLKGTSRPCLLHVETQAHYQHQFPMRMLGYFAGLHGREGVPVYPIAVLSFDKPKEPQKQAYELDVLDLEVIRYKYALVQLNRLDWRDYVKRQNSVAAAFAAKMNIAHQDRPVVKLKCMRLLASLKLTDDGNRTISEFIDAYLRLDSGEQETLKRELSKLNKEERKEIMEITTSWKEEGRLEGRQEGRQEGRLEAMVSVASKQLNRRISNIPAKTRRRIEKLTVEQLEALTEALLDFATLADLEEWLAKKPS